MIQNILQNNAENFEFKTADLVNSFLAGTIHFASVRVRVRVTLECQKFLQEGDGWSRGSIETDQFRGEPPSPLYRSSASRPPCFSIFRQRRLRFCSYGAHQRLRERRERLR